MRRHWQREPLLVRGAFEAFEDPLSPREVLAMAGRDDVQSRLVRRRGARWSLEHGLTVELLADTDWEVCKLYEVIQEKIVDGHPKACLLRSTFVIDKKGVVRHILQEINPRAHVDEVLKVCRELNGKRAN